MRTVLTCQAEARATSHKPGIFFLCDRCRQIKPVGTEGGTGYGYMQGHDRLICYACCGRMDRDDMRAKGKVTLYLSKDEAGSWHVGDWPGTLRFPCTVRPMRHPFASQAYVAHFTGPDGKPWSGKNIGDSQIIHCRRLKNA